MSEPIKLRLAQLRIDESIALSSRVQATVPPKDKPHFGFGLDKASSQLMRDYEKITEAIKALKAEFDIDYAIESYKVILNILNVNGNAFGEAVITVRRTS